MFINCHTGFSFKYGTLSPGMLADEAMRCGVHKLVITEINNTASYLELLRLCDERKKLHTQALEIAVGVEFRNQDKLTFIAIAKNNEGFEEITRFLSKANRDGVPFPRRAPSWANVVVIYPWTGVDVGQLGKHEFVGIKPEQLRQYSIARSNG